MATSPVPREAMETLMISATDPSFDLISSIKTDGLKIVCIGAGCE